MIKNTCPNLLLFKDREFNQHVQQKKLDSSKASADISYDQSKACDNASGLD